METQLVNAGGGTVYAGFLRRFAAFLIDSLPILVVLGILLLLIFWAEVGKPTLPVEHPAEGPNDISSWLVHSFLIVPSVAVLEALIWMVIILFILVICSIVISWLYFALMESSTRQATLGKMALGIIVSDMNGQRISFARATGRHFTKIISGVILVIGFIMAGFTAKKQALHDMIAGCVVVKKR
jgi:uncharacterized RDD family membrane protein YckC